MSKTVAHRQVVMQLTVEIISHIVYNVFINTQDIGVKMKGSYCYVIHCIQFSEGQFQRQSY